jgi:hypothetical protein
MCPFYIVFIYGGAPALRAVGPLQGSLCSVRVAHPRQGAAFRATWRRAEAYLKP